MTKPDQKQFRPKKEVKICRICHLSKSQLNDNSICGTCVRSWKRNKQKPKKQAIRKESQNNYPKALKEAKASFQRLRRIQEADENGFVTCVHGKIMHWTKADGGHHYPGHYLFTCFNPLNVWPQEKNKNLDMQNPSTVMEYRNFLTSKIGIEKLEWLESVYRLPVKFSTFELVEMKKEYDRLIEVEMLKLKKITTKK